MFHALISGRVALTTWLLFFRLQLEFWLELHWFNMILDSYLPSMSAHVRYTVSKQHNDSAKLISEGLYF